MTLSLKRVAGPLLLALCPAAFAAALDDVSSRLAEGEYAAALRLLDQTTIGESDLNARFLRATALAANGQDDRAVDELEAIIRDFPDAPEPYNNLAALYASRGDFEKAKGVLERAIRTNESYATVYENLSTVYVEMARNSYVKALRLDKAPKPPELRLLYTVSSGAAPEQNVVTPAVAPAPAPAPAPVEVAAATPTPAAEQVEAEPPAAEPASAAAATTAEPAPGVEPPTAVAAAPATGLPPAPERDEKGLEQAAMAALKRWAQAWSEQDVDGYLAAYGEAFQPDEGMSRADWAEQRRQRLHRPEWIKVQLNDFDIRRDGDAMQVELIQEYRSNTYQDRTLKRFELVEEAGEWRIRTEETVKTVR